MYYRYFDKEKNRLKNYYKLLRISRDSDDELIHQQYQDLYESGKTTQETEEAYSILSNPEERDRYNRVYDRYNWDYGIQKNSLYEKAKPKNHGRVLFIILLFVLLGFSTIAFFFFRTPEASAPSIEITAPEENDTESTQTTKNPEPESPVSESQSIEESPAQPAEETESPTEPIVETPAAIVISDELLAAYPNLEVLSSESGEYPTAQVTAGVNFRTAPSMESTVISAVGTDESFSVLGKVGGWSYIYRENEGYGWIGGKYIQYTN